MARTRSVQISESISELENLRAYYAGKSEAQKIGFLLRLREDKTRTISEAARRSKISERRGRYWWDAYRSGGLTALLERRVWRSKDLGSPEEARSRESHVAGASVSGEIEPDGRSWTPFLNAIATSVVPLKNSREWLVALRSAIQELIPEVDFIVLNVRTGIDVNNPEKERNEAYHQRSDEHGVHERSAESSTDYQQPFQGLIARGQRANFPFADYHPPESFDFFLELGKRTRHTSDNVDSYIGSILLFSRLDGPELPREAADLVERLRPFFTYVFSDYSARIDSRDSGGDGRMYQFIERVAADAGLSPQEHRVLMLGFLGHPYKDMAEILHVSVNTVQSHISSIYRKTGVSKIGEIYARYFAGLEMTGERSEPENTIGRL